MKSKVFTVAFVLVLTVIFTSFLFAADKSSKIQLLNAGDNSQIVKLPKSAKSTVPSAPLYKVPAVLQWINHTDSNMEYYLGSGAAGDTMAVWYKGAGACSLYTIENQWYDGDASATVLFYVWEASDNPQVGDPGLAASRLDWEGGSPLGAVAAGPIPFAPSTSGDWQTINIEDFFPVPFFGDTEGTPAAFFVGFVKQDAVPHPLADDVGAKGYTYSWFGGPWTEGAWGWYNVVIEFGQRIGVTYPYGAKPTVGGIAILPDTYNGAQDFEVSATVTDEGTVTGAWLHWAVNSSAPVGDSVAMVADGDLYTGSYNPGAALGDTVYYWVSAKDNDGNYTIENLLSPNSFEVIAPVNANPDILLVLDNTYVDPADFPYFTWETILDSLGYTCEVWDVGERRGIDASVTTYAWGPNFDGIVNAAWGTSVIPTRAYEPNQAFAAFLNAGGSLFFTDQDYFFGNGEDEEPTFVAGDFAFDFFSISGGSNDPGNPDSMIIGAEGDEITDFMSADFVPMRPDDWVDGGNWTDYLIADQADFILTSEEGPDVGVKYEGAGFKTVLIACAIEAMNDITGWSDTTAGAWDSNFITLVSNSLDWLGFVPSVDAIEMVDGIVPQRFSLEQNYPNPFNPSTVITFNLAKKTDVELNVYSVTGQKVRSLVKGNQKAGQYTVTWNGRNDVGQKVASGLYFYKIEADDFVASKKMILIK